MSYSQSYFEGLSQTKKDYLGFFFILISTILWVSGFIYANENNMAASQSSLSRHTIMLLISYSFLRLQKKHFRTNFSTFKLTMLRGLIYCGSSLIMPAVQFYLPLNICHTIACTGVLFGFVHNHFINGDPITSQQIKALVISFVGIILMINGRLFYEILIPGYEFQTQFRNYKSDNVFVQIAVSVGFLFWTCAWSFGNVLTKAIKQYGASEMLFIQAIVALPICGVSYFWTNPTPFGIYWPSLLWMGLVLAIANYLFTYGFKLASNAGKVGMAGMGNIVFGYFLGVFRYDEELNWFCVLGTIVIVFGIYIALFRDNRS